MIPGMVNTHHHMVQSLTRCVARVSHVGALKTGILVLYVIKSGFALSTREKIVIQRYVKWVCYFGSLIFGLQVWECLDQVWFEIPNWHSQFLGARCQVLTSLLVTCTSKGVTKKRRE